MTWETPKSDFVIDPIPEDQHLALCIGIFTIGQQFNPNYKKWVHKIIFQFELPGVRFEGEDADGNAVEGPRFVSREFGFSLSDRGHLKPFIQSWLGKTIPPEEEAEFEWMKLLGRAGIVQIVWGHGKGKNKGKIYSNIQGIMKVPKGTEVPDYENQLRSFYIYTYTTRDDLEDALENLDVPEWIANKVRDSKEYKNLVAQAEEVHVPEPDDDIPF